MRRHFGWLSALCALGAVSCVSTPLSQRMPASTSNGGIQHPALQKTERDFDRYIGGYAGPEIFQDNNEALRARLKLLDQVPSGGTVKIMTFVYENGESTRRLAAHMCLAAKRGVRVQFLPDSKSGDRPGVDDAFDAEYQVKMNEEVYQMLANCGVEVKIHNHIAQFDKLAILGGKHIPLIPKTGFAKFTNDWASGRVGRGLALRDLKNDLTEVLAEQAKEVKGLIDDKTVETVKSALYQIVFDGIYAYFQESTIEGRLTSFDATIEQIRTQLKDIPLVSSKDRRDKVKKMLYSTLEKIQKHPRLGEFYRQVRIFNRLNHRKLFWVEYAGNHCMFLGGRNLGDHYLTFKDKGDQFMDGDVMICDHHLSQGKDSSVTKQASASFDQLWNNTDKDDPLNVPPVTTEIKPDYGYKFSILRFPEQSEKNWGTPMWVMTPHEAANDRWYFPNDDVSKLNPHYEGITLAQRQIPAPIFWEDQETIHGVRIQEAYGWRVRTATWNTSKDLVRKELVAAINREQRLIYVETAYSEFNSELRAAFEAALKRGVQVRLVTNSIFVSDAGSKAIRIVMARWTRQMLEKYPTLFIPQFASITFGHMIHFKGASFQCQKNGNNAYRLNLIGSHNFHGRSGYSDKEHALVWEQPANDPCLQKLGFAGVGSKVDSLMEVRDAYYLDLAIRNKPLAPLKAYSSFAEELEDGINSKKLSAEREAISRWALKVLYSTDGVDKNGKPVMKLDSQGRALLRAHDEFVDFLEILSEVGITELVGVLL